MMLTDRQLADIQADAAEVLSKERVDPAMRLLARHCQYLLDEVARLSEPHDWSSTQAMMDFHKNGND